MKPILTGAVLIALGACAQGNLQGSGDETSLQASCEALVSSESGTRIEDVKALETQPDPRGSVTAVTVAGQSRPWTCSADPTGVIYSVIPG